MSNEYLMHFNPFHDPKNGQFTSSGIIGYKVAENMSGGNLVNMVSTQKYKVRK